MKDAESNQELLLRYLDDSLPAEEQARVADLLRCDAQARAFLREVAEQAVTVADVERVEHRRQSELGARQDWAGNRRQGLGRVKGLRMRSAGWPWAVAAAAVVALIASVYFHRPSAEPEIAKITGLSGSLQWTGDGGRVFHDLSVGTELPGGTIEGMVPGSWFELEFNDGSTVMISGNSTLTFSDHGQKKLHLKEGNVSGNVKPQPEGKPMLIYTRSAVLEIMGTRFEVEAGFSATMLNVSEGKVHVKRLSDGSTVEVPARHRVIAAADREMLPVPVPDAAYGWKSQLHLGPEGAYGRWSPRTATQAARLEAIPYTMPRGFTIYAAAFGVSHGDRPPVMLQSGSHLRVRGRIASTHKVYFGVTVRRLNGEFAGKFQTIRPAEEFEGGQDFEVVLQLRDFRLDPSLIEMKKMKSKLPRTPFDLAVESFWCHTLDQQAGLEIAEVELLPAGASAISQSTTAEPPQVPIMDIWTAVSKGNMEAVKHHLAAGVDIDEAFVAPGIPASGAMPLHLAVLSDQGEIARFLIRKQASLNARAKDEHGGTPLHWAAVLGRIEMAGRLIAAGADVNAADNNGYTPLDWTSYERISEGKARLEIAELLRQRGGKNSDVQTDQ
jgi:hypothetical protein